MGCFALRGASRDRSAGWNCSLVWTHTQPPNENFNSVKHQSFTNANAESIPSDMVEKTINQLSKHPW